MRLLTAEQTDKRWVKHDLLRMKIFWNITKKCVNETKYNNKI